MSKCYDFEIPDTHKDAMLDFPEVSTAKQPKKKKGKKLATKKDIKRLEDKLDQLLSMFVGAKPKPSDIIM